MTHQSPELQEAQETTHNLNHEVLIRVTDVGEQIWEEHFAPYRIAVKEPDAFPLKRDEDGFTKMQLWEVMQVFGAHMQNGGKVPIETKFRFVDGS